MQRIVSICPLPHKKGKRMARRVSKLDAPLETRCLIHQGTVNNQLLSLLKATEGRRRRVVLMDPSLTISWPTTPGQLPDNTMVFARDTVITRLSPLGMCPVVFKIEGRAAAPCNEVTELMLTIHAAEGKAWVPPQS
jgi:hypothetical protein